MARKLFCEISPLTYAISRRKEIWGRNLKDLRAHTFFAVDKSEALLPVLVCRHKSLMRRKLGQVDMRLQENKAVNLSLAAPKVSGILIHPGETFSFWQLVGDCKKSQGYREGLTITGGHPTSGIGGGMCQFTNLIHWLVLHSPLTITEHHHHNGLDLFPDYHRKTPFGVGTSISYNTKDYRFENNTPDIFQLVVWTDETYLHGQLLCDHVQPYSYHIHTDEEYFYRGADGSYYRHNRVWRRVVEKRTGKTTENRMLLENNARVVYDPALIPQDKILLGTPDGDHPDPAALEEKLIS